MTAAEAMRATLTLRKVFTEELKAARPGATFKTLPLCPICGAPPSPYRLAGILCIARDGKTRDPHTARVDAWRKAYREGT